MSKLLLRATGAQSYWRTLEDDIEHVSQFFHLPWESCSIYPSTSTWNWLKTMNFPALANCPRGLTHSCSLFRQQLAGTSSKQPLTPVSVGSTQGLWALWCCLQWTLPPNQSHIFSCLEELNTWTVKEDWSDYRVSDSLSKTQILDSFGLTS